MLKTDTINKEKQILTDADNLMLILKEKGLGR